MIRMVLFGLGFVAITLALVIIQPGSNRDAAGLPVSEKVTRAAPELAPELGPVQRPAGQPDLAVLTPQTINAQSANAVAALGAQPLDVQPQAPGGIDDQSLRKMTWDTLSSLNHATGREAAPGQPGSLLHTIVKRSMDAPDGVAAPGTAQTGQRALGASPMYVVQPGDSLISIAQKVYGDVNMTGPLFAANQAILSRPDDLKSGQTLILPRR